MSDFTPTTENGYWAQVLEALQALPQRLENLLTAEKSEANTSSGTTAKATLGGGVAVDCIAANATNDYHHLMIDTGGVAGFFSWDGGTTWHRIGARMVLGVDGILIHNTKVQIKDDGANAMSDIFVSVW